MMSNEELNPSVVGDKVYAVSSGEYSDYHIDRVFRTRKEAEGWISKRWEPSRYNVEVWEFDTLNPSERVGFEVVMELKTGQVLWGEESRHDGPAEMRAYYYEPGPLFAKYRSPCFRLEVQCLAHDKEHAIKITSEYRRMVLASPLWEVWKNSPDPSCYEMKFNEIVPCDVV